MPGAAERTLTISSAGKTFSVTGWKIGWIHGPAELITAVLSVKQFLTYVNGGPFQPAVAAGLRLPDAFFADAAERLHAKHELLAEGLTAAGFEVHRPDGGYFTVADATAIGGADADAFCRALPERHRRRRDPAHRVRASGAPRRLPRAGALRRLQTARGHRRGRRAPGGAARPAPERTQRGTTR